MLQRGTLITKQRLKGRTSLFINIQISCIVWLPAKSRYVALSHVWGEATLHIVQRMYCVLPLGASSLG